ncbi:AMP-binding protein [Effusibacillus lacus]|uniref:acetate--CoA ligase n=1 Tax=Effusibacillus lacus TaxID=1348429 RepID=A0A292YCX6_9BACL|nr:AMP-binding protein [Effusibacillus lacus]TCS71852.1 acetyl-CoA synthetase [Effusibacillus lacus]GAX89582.1 AMP-dependent synthetase [Effusibacillus lacus]
MTSKAVWVPDQSLIESTRLYQWMKQLGFDDYESFLQASVKDIAWFWQEAERVLGIEWFRPYETTLDLSKGIKWPDWYVGGQLNVVHNAVDKWAKNPATSQQTALVWEGDDGTVKRYTFAELSSWVARVALGLRKQGIDKGDRISIYMPMIPETVVVMLAAAKIGAMFSPAFSGYGADAVATRLNAATAKMLVTADGFLRRGKAVPMKEEADKAAAMAPSVEKVVVVRRLGRDIPWTEGRDMDWSELDSATGAASTQIMNSSDPLMLLYTSGTTGKPKGAVHTHAGFPLKAAFDAGICMDLKQGDTLFWVTDMGWMMGPFMIFGALLNGAAAVLYEGSPDYPEPDRLWKLTADHRVTHLGISPTLIRSLMKHGESWVKKHDISSLRVIGSTGEPWNPEPWMWLFERVGNSRIPIFNYSGGTEISGGILGNVLVRPIGPVTFNSPLPGMDVQVYDEHGQPVRNTVGELVIKQPWVGMTNGFWQEPERYESAYWNRWPDTWVHGDWVTLDDEGFWTITGRSDDTLNVAGKRLGPAEVESVLVGHPAVLEAGTIGVPDELKGEVAVCFVVLRPGHEMTDKLRQELLDLVADKLGKALRPKTLYFVNDLPKTRNGKILRRAMRAAYLDKDAGDLSSLENPDAVETVRKLAHNN